MDNQKGLLINFNIIGTEVAGRLASPSLTANFGNLSPGAIQIAEWWFTSSLEGLFTDYTATFQNADVLGNPRLSPIQGVEIHEITHMVQADGAWDDGQPDFLVIDPDNVNSLPNALYLSDGTIQPVSVVQTATNQGPVTSGNLRVQITANFPAGFTYVLVPDPANGQFPLQAVLYANGTNFLTNNFWITDRTFIGLGQPPLLQTNLHLFAYHTNVGPDTYTLIYGAPTNLPQTNPPVSAVFALPAQSPPTFGVVWSGAPYVGGAPIAYYDIYVSDNGGPFTLWQSQSTGTGSLYNGTSGHTYAFYSLVTDTAGNRETPPLQPQAQTTVILNTTPPTISVIPNVTLNAGQTLSLTVTASDPNPQNTLTFSLGPGAPVGVVINPDSGQITWATSPSFGGTTNLISVIATDDGQPPLSATNTFTVIVKEVNVAPVLPSIGTQAVNELTLLTVTNTARESNIHSTLGYALASPPAGMVIDANGIITWTPQQNQSPSTNLVTTVVTNSNPYDLVNPHLSATNSFVVVVAASQPVKLSASLLPSRDIQLIIEGASGRTYTLLISTNLIQWDNLMVFTNVTVTPFTYSESTTNSGKRFYRVQVGP